MSTEIEDVESFRLRAREWIKANLEPDTGQARRSLRYVPDEEELAAVEHDRRIQRMLYDAGFAGICFPKEYGGLGLPPEYQTAFNEEMGGYEYPSRFQVPTLVPCAAVILEFGTEEQKLEHLPKILRGEELWIQFLSEPSGGSDVAGALTSAVRDGDEWVLNGSKVWSSGAWWSDWALCLARTNWDVPKHRGLTVFMLPVNQPNVEINRIEMLSGSTEFCQEYLTDVRVPDSDRVGEVDQGWTVGTRWMVYERMAHHSPLCTTPVGSGYTETSESPLISLAAEAGRLDDPLVRDLIGEAEMLATVGHHLGQRLGEGLRSGKMHPDSTSVARLFHGLLTVRQRTITFDVAGAAAAAWADGEIAGGVGSDFLMRQSSCIGGGTTEIARNVIAERVLGMPREPAPDHGTPFRDVPRGQSSRS